MILPGVGQGVGYLLIIRKMTVKKKKKKNKQRKQPRTYPDSTAESKKGQDP